VISIGNIAAGGRAKTPLVALVAERLRDMGERPAILSRGYARRDPADGVVVVRDPRGIRADLDRAGDEPLMLARRLDGVSVLVSSNRYLAGRLAEHHFACTVHVLDDGFQHFDLRRDADVVAIAPEDLDDPRTLPTGHLREPIDAAAFADAFVAIGEDVPIGGIAAGTRPVWRARRRLEAVQAAEPEVAPVSSSIGPVLALAGIAEPRGFFQALRAAGWTIARELPFRDHHSYTRADVRRMLDALRASGARAVLTTEKDLVRLLPLRPFPFPVAYAPLALDLEQSGTFEAWLRERIAAARESAAVAVRA
jgi:tetraacyldisaccharide 4'-kinase